MAPKHEHCAAKKDEWDILRSALAFFARLVRDRHAFALLFSVGDHPRACFHYAEISIRYSDARTRAQIGGPRRSWKRENNYQLHFVKVALTPKSYRTSDSDRRRR